MRRQKTRDTRCEIDIRKGLHARGLRFRVGFGVAGIRARIDIAFTRAKLAVFVDGCFWHACPTHASWPKRNAEAWRAKIETNRRRDANVVDQLGRTGWQTLRIWEHEDPAIAASRILAVIARKRSEKHVVGARRYSSV